MSELNIPKVWINSAKFSDGTMLEFGESDIVVFVGPNNVGKSVTLRDMQNLLRDKEAERTVVKKIQFMLVEGQSEVHNWLQSRFKIVKGALGTPMYKGLQASASASSVDMHWHQGTDQLGPLSGFFSYHISADARLQAATPVVNVDLLQEPLEHPIHYIQKFESVEIKASQYFEQAFKQALLVYRNAGKKVPLFVGKRPPLDEGEAQLSVSY